MSKTSIHDNMQDMSGKTKNDTKKLTQQPCQTSTHDNMEDIQRKTKMVRKIHIHKHANID
jgi:hypothetical protein